MRTYFNALFDKQNDAIYVSGGVDSKSYMKMKNVQKFDLKTEEWSTQPSMLKSRVGHAAFLSDGYMYAFGGKSDTVERLQLSENKQWEQLEIQNLENLTKTQFGFTHFMPDNTTVYIFGGQDINL